jgi:hypothetical protein
MVCDKREIFNVSPNFGGMLLHDAVLPGWRLVQGFVRLIRPAAFWVRCDTDWAFRLI